MTDHNPPQDIAAEQSILGAMMTSRTAARDVADILNPEDFYRPNHEAIYRAITHLDGSGEPIDAMTVAAELDRLQLLSGVGGRIYLAELLGVVTVASNATHYAEIVRDKAGKRRLIDAALRITHDAHESAQTADEQAENARAMFDKAMPGRVTAETYDTAMPRVIETMERGTSRGLGTGWVDLDRLIHGLRPGLLYVVGARPGVGKSIVGLQLASIMDETHGKATYFASLEMTGDEIVQRSLAARSLVPLGRLIDGRLSEHEWARLAPHADHLRGSRVHLADSGRQTIGTIRSGARTLARRGSLGLVVIDYLQLMAARDPKLPREQQVAEMSRGAKMLAKELAVPVVLLSQLNRAGLPDASGTPRPPTLQNLRESGAIEQDADVVILLHKPDDRNNEIEAHVAKNRSGALGVCNFIRQGEFARLVPAARN